MFNKKMLKAKHQTNEHNFLSSRITNIIIKNNYALNITTNIVTTLSRIELFICD